MFTKSLSKLSGNKLWAVSLGLGGLALIFCILLLFSGPRIRRVVYDADKLPREVNQTIVLRSNQPLANIDKAQVTIDPKVEFNLTTSGEAAIIQLKQRLSYDTKYKVTIKDFAAKSGRKASYETTIHTGKASYFYLKRSQNISLESLYGDKIPDTIYSGSIDDKDQVVYQAYKILEFAPLGSRLVIHHEDEDERQYLTIYNPKDKTEEDVNLPEDNGTIDQLRVSSTNELVGFLFSSKFDPKKDNKYNSTLFAYDTGSKFVFPQYGLERGKLLSVSSWRFHPDGTSMIIQTFDNTLLLVDYYSNQKPVPLGSYFSIGTFSRDGRKVVVGDNDNGPVILELEGQKKVVPEAGIINGIESDASEIILLQNSDDYILIKEAYRESDGAYTRVAEVTRGAQKQVIYSSNQRQEQLFELNSSPNEQMASIELSDVFKNRKFDGYGTISRPTNMRTRIVDINTGKTIKDFDGFQLHWY